MVKQPSSIGTQILKALPHPIANIASNIISTMKKISEYVRIKFIESRKKEQLRRALLIKNPGDATPDYSALISGIHPTVPAEPKASVIICVYNNINYTLNCMNSLIRCKNNTPFEIIIVDDCSHDETENTLRGIDELRYFRNQTNLGFLLSANKGAECATGDYLVFLNNDTITCDHWLDSLINHLERNSDIGLVGSKLIYPDYILQEAGGLVFSDGDAMNYGRMDHPDRMQYNYCRDVDYCSGASIAIRKGLFFSLGKFSEEYAPCYYEDTDLAFKVKQAGYRVCYVPESVVIHFEGITCGTDTSCGLKKFQDINKERFKKKWSAVLSEHLDKNTIPSNKWLIPHLRKKKCLVLDQNVPKPDQDSGSYRISNIMKILSKENHVTFWPVENNAPPRYKQQLRAMGIEILDAPLPTFFIRKNGRYFDYVILSRADILSENLDLIKKYCTNAKIIFDTVDLHYIRFSRQIPYAQSEEEKIKLREESEKYHAIELHGFMNASQTWVVTETEKEIVRKQDPLSKVHVIPNIHPLPDIRGKSFHRTKDILFIGSFGHSPNIDAVLYFIKEIWPLVKPQIPEAHFIVVGPYASKEIKALAADKVVIRGYVPDLDHDLIQARVFVSPLRYGAGMKGKIGQALSYGIPTVTTSIGAEGFGFSGREIIIEDDPVLFAQSIISLYTDEMRWEAYQKNCRAFMQQFTPLEVEKLVHRALNELSDRTGLIL